ncbi:hypothetical protein BURK_001730 [Burkholderia sp. SJ98]|nr:hypothetical protein BURK_001730 [Burkholderia sp. SJ98]
MKEVKRIVSLIEGKRKTLERLQADLNNYRATEDGSDQFLPQLEELRLERRDILAKALIAKKTPNTQSIDAKLQTVEAEHAKAREAAQSARDAMSIVAHGIDLENAELEALQQQLKGAIRSEIVARHDEAAAKYADAVTQLGEVVAQMVAAERAWKHVVTNVMDENGNGSEFPRRGVRVLEDIRETGVRVPASASRLSDPKVAAEYGDSFDRFWYLPTWADPATLGFADEEVSEIVSGLRESGVEAREFVGYRPAPPEPQLKVRVRRGVIQSAPKVQRDPETGHVVTSEPVEFREGDDVYLDESQARALQRGRMVYVHGEDDIPEPSSVGGPVEIDAALPKEEARRPSWKPEQRREYTGNHFPLDLSAYGD